MAATTVRDGIRQALNLGLAAGQLVLPPLLFARGFDAGTAVVPTVADPNTVTPAGYAFAVWGVIYIGSAAHAVVQALPSQRRSGLFRAIGWWTAAGYLLCCLWLVVARIGPVWATVPVILAMLVTLGHALVVVRRWPEALSRTQRLCVAVPLGIYVGWLSAATFVNAADVLPAFGFDRFGLSAEQYGLASIIAAAAVALVFTVRTRGFLPYVATVVWALIAIVVANGGLPPTGPISLAATVASALIITVSIVLGRGPRPRSSARAD
ncbi:MAG: hypothetical protein Q8S03_04085 [Brevundimonas sp.]|uniref:hypothetical protein n=1 Tax=Brevundimonas sp. TaxID=1871086 RepID=UPI002733A513|nr:hypothetical protein [Brevundimonas sp.]MDP3403847.1 hypothetical protein [Brevundimonas sp.]